MSIGERIKQGRLIRGYSQRELTKIAGVSAQAIAVILSEVAEEHGGFETAVCN